MIILKKAISLVLALVIVMSAMTAFAATVPGSVYSDQQAPGANKPVQQIQQELQQAGIKDVKPTDWFAGSVTVLVQSGLLAPKADGSFQPNATLTANEGVAVFAKILGVAAPNDTPEQAMIKAKETGLVDVKTTGSADMSRMDVAKLLASALGVEAAPVTSAADYPFNDFDNVTPEERGILKALYDLGIFKGYLVNGIRTFRPDGVLTRAEIAILVDRILGPR